MKPLNAGHGLVLLPKTILLRCIYHKIPIINPGLIFVQKAVLPGLFFGGAYFWRGLLLEGILRFKMGWV